MNKEQQELLDEIYKNYVKWWEKSDDSCNLERFNIRYPGGRFSIFQENYPNTHRRNNPNDLLDAFNIPTKLITTTYNDKTIESYE